MTNTVINILDMVYLKEKRMYSVHKFISKVIQTTQQQQHRLAI
jgi:hypothetical protein